MSDNILLLAEDGSYLITESGDYIIAVVQYLTTALNGDYSIAGNSATILYVAGVPNNQYYVELRSLTERRRM